MQLHRLVEHVDKPDKNAAAQVSSSLTSSQLTVGTSGTTYGSCSIHVFIAATVPAAVSATMNAFHSMHGLTDQLQHKVVVPHLLCKQRQSAVEGC